MIAKVCRGSRSTGLLYYLLGPGREDEHVDPRVIGSWDGAESLYGELSVPAIGRMLDVGFEQGGVSSEKKVYHVPIRNHDADRTLTDSEWVEVAREMMAETGISCPGDADGARWVVVRHDDNHVHLVATLVGQSSGKAIWPSHDYRAIRKVCNRMEDRFGILSTNPDVSVSDSAPTQAEMHMADGVVTDREQLQQAVRAARSVAKDEGHFFAELDRVGIEVRLNESEDGELRGYSVGWPDADGGRTVWFAGSTLSAELSWPKIADHISVRVAKQKLVPAVESTVSLRKETADAVRGAVELATSSDEFKALLADVGVTVNYRTNGGQITGYAVGVAGADGDEQWFAGSTLDPRLAWGPVKAKLVDLDSASLAWNAEEVSRREVAGVVSAASKLGSSRKQFSELVGRQGMAVNWRVNEKGEPVGYSVSVPNGVDGGEFRFAGSRLDNQPWSKVRGQLGASGPEAGKHGLCRLVDVAKLSAVSEDDFFGQLEASGAVVHRRFSSVNPDEVTGYRVGWEPTGESSTVWYAGSELGRERSWPKIQQVVAAGAIDGNVQGLRQLAVEAKRTSSSVDEFFDVLEAEGIEVRIDVGSDGAIDDYLLAGVSGGKLSAEVDWSTLQHQLDVDVVQLQALAARTEKQIKGVIAGGEIPDDMALEGEGLLTSLVQSQEGVMGGDLTDAAKMLRSTTNPFDRVERSEIGQNLRVLAMGAAVLGNNSTNDAAKLMLLVALAIEATRQKSEQQNEHRQATQAAKAGVAVETWRNKQKPPTKPGAVSRSRPRFRQDPKQGPNPKM